MATNSVAISKDVEATSFWQGAVVVLGRFLVALIFLMAGANHFNSKLLAMRLRKACLCLRSRFHFPACSPSPAA
jgi:hypothetical protein